MMIPACAPKPLVLGCTSCAATYDEPWLWLWALLMLLIVLGTALAVLGATRRMSRLEQRMDRHFTRHSAPSAKDSAP